MQIQTSRAEQAEPDNQRETTAVERLRARGRKGERERGAEKQLRISAALERSIGRGQADECEGTSWLYLACGRVDGD
jgi:hypothetical protein